MPKDDFRYAKVVVRVEETAPRRYSVTVWGGDEELRVPVPIILAPGVFYGDMAPRTVAQSVVLDLFEAVTMTEGQLLDRMEVRAAEPEEFAPRPADTAAYVEALLAAAPAFAPLMWPAARAVKDELTTGEEGGVTEFSLRNARALISAHGLPDEVALYKDERDDWIVEARWPGTRHRFGGFSWGYGGEGPHGLLEFFRMLGADPPITIEDIARPRLRFLHRAEERNLPRRGPKEWIPQVREFVYRRGKEYGKVP